MNGGGRGAGVPITLDPVSQDGIGVAPIQTTFSNFVGGRDPPSLLLLDTLLRPLFRFPDLNLNMNY